MTPEMDPQILHDFANEGDCPNCGDLQVLIDQGLVKPCFEWERQPLGDLKYYPPEPIPAPTESKTPLVTPWDGC
jgi:hypothetical protein